jgi:hypothetical protein
MHHRETETRALADAFRGEEGLDRTALAWPLPYQRLFRRRIGKDSGRLANSVCRRLEEPPRMQLAAACRRRAGRRAH